MTALALASGGFPTPVRPQRVAAYGSQADVPYGCGNVCAQALLAGVDPQTGALAYAVRIANNSQHPLRAQVRFGPLPRPAASELQIAPFSIVEAVVPRVARARDGERAIVDVRGAGLAFSIDAPAALPGRAALARARGALAGLAVAIGSIALAAGLFLVTSAAHTASVARVAPVVALPTPARRPTAKPRVVPVLGTLRMESSAVAGSSLTVAYGGHATGGDVWLLDERGRVYARSRVHARGYSTLAVPESAAGRDLRVVVFARRGAQFAQAARAVAIVPDPSNSVPLDAQMPPPGVTIGPARIASGEPISIRFAPRHGEALVSITDQGGSIVDEIDVPANQAMTSLRAPEVGSASTYDVVVSVARGNGQDETVKPVVVIP